MSDVKVVGLGLATLDVLMRSGELPTWEKGVRLSGFSLDGGGPVGTAMVAVSRLGVPVGYVGIAGNDQIADLKVGSFVENGVDVSRLVRRDQPEKQVVIVNVHEETGERLFSFLGGFNDGELMPAELDREYITGADFLHLEGHHWNAAMQAAGWMHEAGKTVVYDGSKTTRSVPERTRQLVGKVDVLICGSGYGRALTGLTDVWDIGRAILDLGPRIVVQTEGEHGSYTVTRDDQFHTPAFHVDVVDTTGAGDVFHGAFIVGLHKGWDLRTTALFSTAVSSLKCTKLGGRRGIPYYDEVVAFLWERGIELPS